MIGTCFKVSPFWSENRVKAKLAKMEFLPTFCREWPPGEWKGKCAINCAYSHP